MNSVFKLAFICLILEMIRISEKSRQNYGDKDSQMN